MKGGDAVSSILLPTLQNMFWRSTYPQPVEIFMYKWLRALNAFLTSSSPFLILRWKLMASTEAVTMLVLQCRAATMPATSSISFMVTPVPDTHSLTFRRYTEDPYYAFCFRVVCPYICSYIHPILVKSVSQEHLERTSSNLAETYTWTQG